MENEIGKAWEVRYLIPAHKITNPAFETINMREALNSGFCLPW
jgi:hypothetical protein